MADRLFETLRTFDGAPALLDEHLRRLTGTTDDSAIAPLRDAVLARLTDLTDDVVVRIVEGPNDTTPHEIELRPLPDTPAHPVAVTTAQAPGYSYPRKSLERELHDRLTEQAGTDTFEVLILDGDDVIEGTRTNVFTLHGDTLTTPPLGRCLPGITRAALLELAPACGLTTAERELTINDLRSADEIFLTNSLRGIVRTGSLDGTVTAGRNAERHQQLSAALLAHYRDRT